MIGDGTKNASETFQKTPAQMLPSRYAREIFSPIVQSLRNMENKCQRCNQPLDYTSYARIDTFCYNEMGSKGSICLYCMNCYRSLPRECETREIWIRESLPEFDEDTPAEILADWCEEHGRLKDAVWLRKYGK